MKRLRSKDLILLLLHVPGPLGEFDEPIKGRTLLQKMVFLFEKEIYPKFKGSIPLSEDDMPRFEPYRFGPFSKSIIEDVEFLVNLGFVEVLCQEDASEPEETEYEMWNQSANGGENSGAIVNETLKLSQRGSAFVKERVLPFLTDNQVKAVSALKANCLRVGLYRVLQYVYTKYPDSATNSQIRDKVLGRGF